MKRWRSEIELLSVVLMWGVNFPLMKWLLDVFDPIVLNVLRVSTALLALAWVYWLRSGRSVQVMLAPFATHTWEIVRIGIVGWFIYQIGFVFGLSLTSAGSAALIMASAPLWTGLLAKFLGLEKLGVVGWVGLVISIIGTAGVVIFGRAEITLSWGTMLGNIIMLAAALMWGFYTAMARPLISVMSPTALTVCAILPAMPLLVLAAVPFVAQMDWYEVTWLHVLAIIASGALPTGFAIVLWNRGVRTIGASHTAAFGNLVPFVALFSAWWMLGDPVLPAQVIGGTLIIGGLAVMRRSRVQPRTLEPRMH